MKKANGVNAAAKYQVCYHRLNFYINSVSYYSKFEMLIVMLRNWMSWEIYVSLWKHDEPQFYLLNTRKQKIDGRLEHSDLVNKPPLMTKWIELKHQTNKQKLFHF